MAKKAYDQDGITLYQGDALATLRTLPDDHFHTCVTSPPYWQLRDYGVTGQMGLEVTIDEYLDNMTAAFEEVRRVLRPDGTAWINMGDCYAANGGHTSQGSTARCYNTKRGLGLLGTQRPPVGLKPKDLIGMPWRLAFALQAIGWYLRRDIIWHKPNPMPESTTDRPTKSHEYLFLMAKSERYYYDSDAIREPASYDYPNRSAAAKAVNRALNRRREATPVRRQDKIESVTKIHVDETRNKRDVWTVPTKGFEGAHFATYPPDLIKPCILAGTSEKGCCPDCRSPWRRITEKYDTGIRQKMPDGMATYEGGHTRIHKDGREQGRPDNPVMATRTIGWEPTCECNAGNPVPCTVLDIFAGAATTLVTAYHLHRDSVGIELNPKYINDTAIPRIRKETAQQRLDLTCE
jgi:DNA modification methylase